MIIGIPKEIMANENRVAATAETVRGYKKLGFDVMVESGAGEAALCFDDDYQSAGARIVSGPEELYASAQMVLKVKEPVFNTQIGKHEIEMMQAQAMLITFLHPAAPANHDMVLMLQKKNITAFTMDGIPRISRAQKMDALTSMSTVAGYKSVLIAASKMSKFVPMIGTSIGMIKPAQFLIVGAGVVGLQAIATAKRLGAVIKAVDIRKAAREEAASLGAKIAGFDVPAEIAMSDFGYARGLTPEWLEQEKQILAPLVKAADAVILSALVPGEVAPVLISTEIAAEMKPGSVIIDVAVDQGGNCRKTKPGIAYTENGVFICGTKNIPGLMPVDATWLYANNMFYYVENLFKNSRKTFDLDDEIVKSTMVTHMENIVHKGTLKALQEK